MHDIAFSDADRMQMESLGIMQAQVKNQLEIFRRSSFHMQLDRPCTVGNGIRRIPPEEVKAYQQFHKKAMDGGRFLKFVPASGAATRMFKALFQVLSELHGIRPQEVTRRAEAGDSVAEDFLQFMGRIKDFAFYDELKETMARNGLITETLLEEDRFQEILDYLLTEKGLGYGTLPKGLLQFHRYPEGSRTAFEEHLVEAVQYVQDRNGICRLHFTISPEHEVEFRRLLAEVKPIYEKEYKVHYEVTFSFQKESTNTIAVDLDNKPFRDKDGLLLFRAGGHGALLDNLNDLEGDLVYIKNIDNVVPDHLKETTFLWKKVLGGCLVETQETIHHYLRKLEEGGPHEFIDEVTHFVRENLLVHLPSDYNGWSLDEKRDLLYTRLNRPIRVCGVVRNVGEPGGAPFWVTGKDGTQSIQIVEKAQVDFDSSEQNAIWMSSTHFNPVDVVCGLRDYEGKSFHLKDYVDQDAVFISKKSQEGRELKALELPGLWNGAMSDWISLFVEVPSITFNPVKTINDLLRDQHQTES